MNSDAGIARSYSKNHALPEIEANMAPHVAMHSTMKIGSSSRLLSTASANCSKANLAGTDALTMLLFALPSHMWSGIQEPKLSAEFNSLVSIDNFPQILKNEVTFLPSVVFMIFFFSCSLFSHLCLLVLSCCHVYARITRNLRHCRIA